MNIAVTHNWPWAERFAELALRALRRVHLDFGAIHVGCQWRADAPDPTDLNHGVAVAAADELTVCAAIIQECLLSPYFSGAWIKGNSAAGVSAGERYWLLDREECYLDSQKRADFVIKRVAGRPVSDSLEAEDYRDCYVEAKRVRRWTTESLACPNFKAKASLLSEIAEDIQKLRDEFKKRPNKLYGHLLLWDIYDSASKDELPQDGIFKNEQLKGLQLHQLRWMPIDWRHSTTQTSPPTVSKWLWVALLEVKQ